MKPFPTLLRRCAALAATCAISASAATAQIFCQPTYSTPCTVGGDFIQSFSTTGGTTNITNNNSGCNGNANNYQYYSAQTVTASVGGSFNFSFTNSSTNQYYKIWVDWNNNLFFTDPGEEMYASTTNVAAGATVTGSITVPAGTFASTKRMRIRSQFFTNPVTPCGNATYGETEDYNVAVQSTTGCTGTPTVGILNATPANPCPSQIVTLQVSAFTSAPGIVLQWQHQPMQNPPGPYTNLGLPGTNGTLTLAPGASGCYRVAVTCTASAQTVFSNVVCLPPGTACQDSVWPGDANYDLIANNLDLLTLGFSWGLNGTTRAAASNAWTPQFSIDWPQTFNNGINRKNADCDGNGTIGWGDTVAVSQNYGLVHLRAAEDDAPTEKTAGLPDLFVDLTGIPMTPGTTITAPIRFGNAANPVTKVYGIAATVKLSGTAITGAPSVSLNPTWMGTPAQILRFAKTLNTTTADFVASRITRRDTSGYGTLGTVSFAIPAAATGKVKVNLQNVRVVDSTGAVLTAYNVLADSANILVTGIGNTANAVASAAILPNPGATSVLEIQLSKAARLDLLIVDALGKQVWKTSTISSAGIQRVPLPGAALTAGIYTVRLRTADDATGTTLRWAKY